jgi:hypothetical protein
MYILVVEKNSMIGLQFGRLVQLNASGQILKKGPRLFPFMLSTLNLLLRLSRRVIYNVRWIEGSKYIVSCGVGLYVLNSADLSLKKIITPKDFTKCLNVGVVLIEGDAHILYSHYEANLKMNTVNLYAAPFSNLDCYEHLYSFERGTINHIHSYYQFQDKIFLNIGDQCDSVGIWELDVSLKKITPILISSQEYRAVFCFATTNTFYIATDSPGGGNYIKKLAKLNDRYILQNYLKLEGPVIYGIESEDLAIFSTSVEPSIALGWRAWLPLLPIKSSAILYKFSKQSGELEILSIGQKDYLNPYLFGFGSFQFPAHQGVSSKDGLVANKVGLLTSISSNAVASRFYSYDIYDL